MEFNERLMELRKKEGWSQEALGDMLEVTRQTVSKWELGLTTPEMHKLVELSRLFHISIDELLGNAPVHYRREAPAQPAPQVVYLPAACYHYEYKSKRQLFGLPLVHINIGERGLHRAKGIFAVGNVATGFLSVGLFAVGVVPVGCLSLGILSLGAFAVGLLAAGGFAVGGLAVGGLAAGIYSIGGCAIAKDIAMGGSASGHIAIGSAVNGALEFVTDRETLRDVDFRAVYEAILREFPNIWRPILNLFTGLRG